MIHDDVSIRPRSPIPEDEVRALVTYAARQGIEPDAVSELSAAVEAGPGDPGRLVRAYAAVAALTAPVNGRTILDSRDRGVLLLAPVVALSSAFFVLAVGNEMADAWLADAIDPSEEPWWLLVKLYVWDILTPFFWGGLGSCVYLLKLIHDKLSCFEFERLRFRGWVPRILIGALLGTIIQFLVDPSSFTAEVGTIDSNAMAFFTGLGVKAVYAAFERIIDEVSSRLQPKTAGEKAKEAADAEGE